MTVSTKVMGALPWSILRHYPDVVDRIKEKGRERMAYLRWGTLVGFDYETAFPSMDRRDAIMEFLRLDERRRDRVLADQRAYSSSWYVYWPHGSYDSLGRKGQQLWIGSNRVGIADWGAYTFDLLKLIATRGRWALIPGYDRCQDHRDCFNLADAVREWLADVELAFPD